jgi:hypothetical protein
MTGLHVQPRLAVGDVSARQAADPSGDEESNAAPNRLLINVPPGFMKSLLVNVFWPAWEWGPMNMPCLRHLAFSYAQDLTTRDNDKLVRLVTSPLAPFYRS